MKNFISHMAKGFVRLFVLLFVVAFFIGAAGMAVRSFELAREGTIWPAVLIVGALILTIAWLLGGDK